jgi:hypothetical protein
MASLSVNGVFMASKGKLQDIDSYEDEMETDVQKLSHLRFQHVSPLFQECNWTF